LFDKIKKKNAVKRLLEEMLYEKVIQEMSEGQLREGLWGKALAKSNGSNKKARSLYIDYRVQSIKDEIELFELMKAEAEKEANKQGELKPNGQVDPVTDKEVGKELFAKNIINKGNDFLHSEDCIESLGKSEIDWLKSLDERELIGLIFDTNSNKEYAVCKIYLEWTIREYPESHFIDFIAKDRLKEVNSRLGILH
jgi:hypothetical protein